MTTMQFNHSEVAKKLDMSPKAFSLRMNLKEPWRLDEIYALCDLLHISESEITQFFPRDGGKDYLRKIQALLEV